MKIVVTGGTGFLGRHVVWRAAAEGAQVLFTGRNPQAARDVITHAPAPVQWIPLTHGEPDAPTRLTDACQGANVLVHCAALSSPWGSEQAFHQANITSTVEVITAAQTHSVPRLVHISTPSLYFQFADRLNIREGDPLPEPVNTYARTKRAAEDLIHQAQLPSVAILRPRALFGPWDQTLVPRLLRVMQQGGLPIMRGGHIQLDLTYIDNAVEAVWRAATRPLPRAVNTYNVTNDEPRELSDVLSVMAQAFGLQLRTRSLPWPMVKCIAHAMEVYARVTHGKEPPFTRYSAGVLAFSQTLDVSALRTDLAWEPGVCINEGIERHARWWRAYPS